MTSKSFCGLLITVVAFMFMSCLSVPSGKEDNNKLTAPYKTIEVSETSDYLDTKIKYPEFEGLTDLNKRISNTVMSNWKSFKAYSQNEWNAIAALNNRGTSKLPPFEYFVTYEVTGSREIVSVLLNTYIFNGGAHGSTTLSAFNYELSSGKYIDIQKASDMNYNEISTICRNYLYKKLIDEDKTGLPPAEKDAIRAMINTGAFPQAGNFEIYTVDGSKVYVLFEPYAVAPYSYGIQKVQIK